MLGDDHSSHPNFSECPANFRSPWCDDTRGLNQAGVPSSVLSCTAWGFSCLANCSASGELLPRLFTLARAFLKEPAVSFLRHSPSTSAFANVARVFYAACCRVVFGLSSSESRHAGLHQRSSAIGGQFSTQTEIWKPGNEELGATRCTVKPRGSGERFGRTANETRNRNQTKFPGFLVSR